MSCCRLVYAEEVKKVKFNMGLTYQDLMSLGGLTKRQVGLILKGGRGVAIERIETLMRSLNINEITINLKGGFHE